MVVLPLQKRMSEPETEPAAAQDEVLNWVRYAAGVSLIAGGLLLLSRRRRSGIVVASAGTALAMLDQQETLRSWWHTLPSYIDEVQRTLSQVQNAVNDMAAKRETLHRILSR
jgi:hypothetical protein